METEPISLPSTLFQKTLNAIVDRFHLTQQQGQGEDAFLPLYNQSSNSGELIGEVRLFVGLPLFRLVTCSMVVPAMQLDSHMLFAFTPATSAVPHFTLDSVGVQQHLAYHLDLIPRLDLGCSLAYMDEVFTPLTETFDKTCAIEGLQPAQLSPRQRALMSPWMLAHRANAQAFEQVHSALDVYLTHWFTLVDNGISAKALSETTTERLCQRNWRNKALLFHPDIDPVWQRITPLIGADAVAQQRRLLIGADE